MESISENVNLIEIARNLSDAVDRLEFTSPVFYVYNPLTYAWPIHRGYLEKFGGGQKNVIFLGMNPGPYGMVQTGIPFGEISAVRDWMKIHGDIGRPHREHSKRPIEGFNCPRSEVSGRRLWGLFSERYQDARDFFADHFVVNYCPLAFLEESGRNRTPDKLPAIEMAPVYKACDEHLKNVVAVMQPRWLIGVGGFAGKRLKKLFENQDIRLGNILHPSPASPLANRDWAGQARRKLTELGIWSA